jgi:predicted membrane protein
MRTQQCGPGLWPGLFLVSLGAGLLAREFGLLPANVRLVDFWPLLVLFVGIASLVRSTSLAGALFALGCVGLGGVLLASNLGFFAFPAARLWPALLVIVGLAFLIRGARARKQEPSTDLPRDPPPGGAGGSGQHGSYPPEATDTSSDDRLHRQLTFSGAQYRIESQAWRGGKLGVTVGGVELDLRQARLHPDGAVLDLRVVMGGVDLRVPDTWQVRCEVTPLFGGADDTTRSTQGAGSAPLLRVVGTVTLGGITVRN